MSGVTKPLTCEIIFSIKILIQYTVVECKFNDQSFLTSIPPHLIAFPQYLKFLLNAKIEIISDFAENVYLLPFCFFFSCSFLQLEDFTCIWNECKGAAYDWKCSS